jgi:hypothetical protein
MWLTDLFLSRWQPPPLVPIYLFRDTLKQTFTRVGVFILIVLVIGGFRWMPVARLVRAQFFPLREKEFVEAPRALGASVPRQVVRHILPNSLGPVIVAGTIDVAAAIIAESTLSFLGLGFPPDIPTWGRILYDSKEYLDIAPRWALFPGTAIFHRAVHQLRRRRLARRARSAPGSDGGAGPRSQTSAARAAATRQCAPEDLAAAIRGLKTHFKTDDGWLHAVDGVDLTIERGETVCGRRVGLLTQTVTAMTVLSCCPCRPEIIAGEGALAGARSGARATTRCRVRARRSRSSSEPMTSLNPVYSVGEQIAESLRLHDLGRRRDGRCRDVALVRIPTPQRRVKTIRISSGRHAPARMIAIALATRRLLIADEPATALDVTIRPRSSACSAS